jgi:5-methylcytosine-specific restriction endonuclease McrA
MKIGKFVKQNLVGIFRYCEQADHGEIQFLLDPKYSKVNFGVNFPFCALVEDIDQPLSKRYWTEVYLVRGKQVRVTSQWFESSRTFFEDYLSRKNIEIIATEDQDEKAVDIQDASAKKPSNRANSRYRGNPIGNAQNLFIRNILSSLGVESFSESDWKATKEYFEHKCAYCGAYTDLVIEHAIPINREKLGEHRLGNLIPSCKACNTSKAGKDFREFLSGNTAAIEKIEAYMDGKDYVPLEDNEQMKMILNMAHREVSALADRYITIINELFFLGSNDEID